MTRRTLAPTSQPAPRPSERAAGTPTSAPDAASPHAPGRSRLTARRPLSLRARLVFLLMATVAAACLALSVITHVSLREQLSDQLDQQLARAASRALDQGRGPTDGSPDGAGPSGGNPAGTDPSGTDPSGTAPTDAPTGTAPQDAPGSGEYELHAVLTTQGVREATWRDADGRLRQVTDVSALADAVHAAKDGRGTVALSGLGSYRFVVSAEGSDGTRMLTGLPLRPMRSTLARLDLTLLAVGLAALAATGISGSLIVRRTMRPLEEVARIASDVATTPLESGSVRLVERVPAAGTREGTEVGDVGRALNRLLDNVEGAIEVRQRSEERTRRFVADASHELRTPLTAIRGYTEMLQLTESLSEQGERSVARLEAQSRRMTSLVEDLLLLARLDDGAPRADEEIDLAELVLEAGMDAQVSARDHTWSLDVPDEPVLVRGDPRQLAQVIANLLSNARKHTPAGTHVQVLLERGPQPGAVRLAVVDDGPGIEPELVPEVFSRFTRADRARSGSDGTTGLGLPIVRGILRSHGGDIDLETAPGRTAFVVRLPEAGSELRSPDGPGPTGRARSGS